MPSGVDYLVEHHLFRDPVSLYHVFRPSQPIYGFIGRRPKHQDVRHDSVKPRVQGDCRALYGMIFGYHPLRLSRFKLLRMNWLPVCNSSGLDIHPLQHNYSKTALVSYRQTTPIKKKNFIYLARPYLTNSFQFSIIDFQKAHFLFPN